VAPAFLSFDRGLRKLLLEGAFCDLVQLLAPMDLPPAGVSQLAARRSGATDGQPMDLTYELDPFVPQVTQCHKC